MKKREDYPKRTSKKKEKTEKSSELEKLETMHKYISAIIRRKEHFEVVHELLKEKPVDAMDKRREKIVRWDAHVCVKRTLEEVMMTSYLRNKLKNEANTWAGYFTANPVRKIFEI